MAARTHWATDSPELSERERDTAADKRLYVEIGLSPVRCARLRRRGRRQEEQPQAHQRAMDGADGRRMPGARCGRGVRLGCPRLKESIDAAVRDGARGGAR